MTDEEAKVRTADLTDISLAEMLDDEGEFEPAEIAPNAQEILARRYLLSDGRGQDGERNVVEDVEQMWRRVANAVAAGDSIHGASPVSVSRSAEMFYRAMASLDFLPNSPTLMNAGTQQGTLSACFVLPLTDTMEGITGASHAQAMVQKFGGGTGFSLSDLRPKESPISTTHGKACGPVSALRYLSATSSLVTQGGKRDGANMAVLDVHHPDILEFIRCKSEEGDIHNFNISVGVTDEFMEAVEAGTEYSLYFRESPADPGSPLIETGRLDARTVFRKMVEGAWQNGEPGMVFLDEVNRNSPVAHLGRITATNPCGEQPLLPNESCNLGSINLSNFVLEEPAVGLIERNDMQREALRPEFAHLHSAAAEKLPNINWRRLGETVRLGVHFLDNTIDVNEYALPEIREMNLRTRKIGLGVMGFADMLVKLGVAYDSELGRHIGRDIMAFVKAEADEASRELAAIRGPYESWWEGHGDGDVPIRNACRLTVAPTGTISMIANCSSGIEPIFALTFHKMNILGGDVSLMYLNSEFERVAELRGFASDDLTKALCNGESLQSLDAVPQDVKSLFRVASDVSPTDHVLMQAAFQQSVDAGISKTINFPYSATVADVREGYLLAGKTRCKGITVYRDNSRKDQVLVAGTGDEGDQSKDHADSNGHAPDAMPETFASNPTDPQFVQPHRLVDAASELVKTDSFLKPAERPVALNGRTVQVETGRGRLYITLNYRTNTRLFEVFIAHGKAGGNDAAMAEALSRLITMNLRCGVDPFEVAKTLRNISDRPVYSGGKQIMSVPDAVGQIIERYATFPLSDDGESMEDSETRHSTMFHGAGDTALEVPGAGGDVAVKKVDRMPVAVEETCPECFSNLAFEEGCKKCYGCGYSEC